MPFLISWNYGKVKIDNELDGNFDAQFKTSYKRLKPS